MRTLHFARFDRKGIFPTTVRVRTLLLLILMVGAGLGWLSHLRRRTAVDRLLVVVQTGILLEIGPSLPRKDPTHEPDRPRYLRELRRIRELHAERLAVTSLTKTLQAARLRGDEKSMRGALAALLWLPPDSANSLPEIIRTAKGAGFPASDDQRETQIRTLAIHLLGVLAAKDDAAVQALTEIREGPDDSFQRFISTSAANELGGLGARPGRRSRASTRP